MVIVLQSKNFCFNKSFIRNCTISTGIPNLGVWRKNMIQLDFRTIKSDPTQTQNLWLRNPGHNTSVLLVLFFIPARSHAAKKRSSACWKACWEDASSTQSPEKSRGLFLQFPTVTPSSTSLSIAVVLNRERALQEGVNKFPREREPLRALQHGKFDHKIYE